jgi:hypothetical protein
MSAEGLTHRTSCVCSFEMCMCRGLLALQQESQHVVFLLEVQLQHCC